MRSASHSATRCCSGLISGGSITPAIAPSSRAGCERRSVAAGAGRAGLRTKRDAAKPMPSASAIATGIDFVTLMRLRASAVSRRNSARRRARRFSTSAICSSSDLSFWLIVALVWHVPSQLSHGCREQQIGYLALRPEREPGGDGQIDERRDQDRDGPVGALSDGKRDRGRDERHPCGDDEIEITIPAMIIFTNETPARWISSTARSA